MSRFIKYGLATGTALLAGAALGNVNRGSRAPSTPVPVLDPSTWKKHCLQPSFTFTVAGDHFLLEPRKWGEYNLFVALTGKNMGKYAGVRPDPWEQKMLGKARPPGLWAMIDEAIYADGDTEAQIRASMVGEIKGTLERFQGR